MNMGCRSGGGAAADVLMRVVTALPSILAPVQYFSPWRPLWLLETWD